jgi:riboflavin kinase/FMN adenylyltransferase
MGERYGFNVYVLQPVNINGRLASSTAIRNLLKEGDTLSAKELLGRYYSLRGKVIKGKGLGSSVLKIPTANLEVKDRLIPKKGVYATFTHIKEQRYLSVTNIGFNPTFDENSLSIETHILDYYSDLLDMDISVEFVKYLRDEVRFSAFDELRTQISKDINIARELLSGMTHK